MRALSCIARAVVLTGLLALGVAGCGGSHHGPVASDTPDQIVAAATRAIDAVSTVRVSGTVGRGAHAVTLDLHLVSGRGATGTLSQAGLSFRLITVGGEAYVDGTPGFWRQFGGAAVARRLQGHWLRAPAGSGRFASFASLTDAHRLLSSLLGGHGALSRGPATTIDGVRAVSVTDASRHGSLFVAATGTPYPLRIAASSSAGDGRLDFSEFDRPVTLHAPAASIALSTLSP